MAEVRINRELLTDILLSLAGYHEDAECCCDTGNLCVVAQRIQRTESAISRSRFQTQGAPV